MRMRYLLPMLLLVAALLVACDVPPAGSEKTVYVGPELVECVGEAPQKCMQVKENAEEDWTLFYDQIEGFTFEAGYNYELRVREETVESPPAGASAIKWVLIEEVSRTPVVAAGTEEETAGEDETGGEEMPTPGNENQMVFLVGPELVECEGVGPQQCMLVKRPGDEEYGLFYDQIEGFTFEPGYEYELLVLVEPVADPPADGSSLKYTLVEELSRTPAETSGEVAGAMTLEGPLWVLTSLLGTPDAMTPALPDTTVTAQFAEGRVAGNAGCNSYTGPATVDGNKLTIGQLASTLMMCASEEVGTQENTYLSLLQSTATYAIEGDQLTLFLADGNPILVYQAVEPTALEDTLWVMTAYNNGVGGVQSAVEGSEVTALFANGEVNGSAGCNTYSGEYTLDGGKITIGPLASTRMFCGEPEGLMDQESAFLAAMQNTATYEIQMDTLELFDADGARQATFIAAPPAEEGSVLAGSSWTAVNIATPNAISTLIAGTEITAQFGEDGTLSGTAGCNNYSFGYTVDGQNITINPAGISTNMFCEQPEGVMDQEAAYLAALPLATTFAISGGQLTLFDAAGAIVAVYDPAPSTPLTGVNWTAVNIRTADAVSTLVPDSAITALFGEDGSLSGNAGCNNYNFSYTVDGQNITISPAGISTGMFCELPEGVMDQEAAYLAALPLAATYAIQGGQLTLFDADGAIVATYDQEAVLPLMGTNWTAIQVRTGDAVNTLVAGTEITALFSEEGFVGGIGGCNNYSFSFTVDGQNITMNPAGISTQMFCEAPEGVMDQEAAYLAALPMAASFTIEGGQLTLFDAAGAILVVYDEVENLPLSGTNWLLSSFHTTDAIASLLAGTEISLVFGDDGQATGSAGCNSYFGGYVLEGESLTIGPLGATRMACEEPKGVMEQETDYLAMLDSVASYMIVGDMLTLLGADGQTLLTFTAAE